MANATSAIDTSIDNNGVRLSVRRPVSQKAHESEGPLVRRPINQKDR